MLQWRLLQNPSLENHDDDDDDIQRNGDDDEKKVTLDKEGNWQIRQLCRSNGPLGIFTYQAALLSFAALLTRPPVDYKETTTSTTTTTTRAGHHYVVEQP